jgi:GxxExxY protein
MASLAQVRDAAEEVLKVLGEGYAEAVYEEALAHELRLRGIPYERQRIFEILYKGYKVSEGRADLIVNPLWAAQGGKELVVELKAVRSIAEAHKRQCQVYMMSLNIEQGGVVSFASEVLCESVERPGRRYDRRVTRPRRSARAGPGAALKAAAQEVYRYFGQEFIYREDAKKLFPAALAVELRLRGLGFTFNEHAVLYKGHEVATHAFDFTFSDGTAADVGFYRKPEQVTDLREETAAYLRLFDVKRGYVVAFPEQDTDPVVVKPA